MATVIPPPIGFERSDLLAPQFRRTEGVVLVAGLVIPGPPMREETPFHRVRWTIRARSSCCLHTFQNAILYAALCEAARDEARGPHMPEGLLLDAPEIGRIELSRGEGYAFGATLIEADSERAARRLHDLSAGLARLGAAKSEKPVALGGNFDVVKVEDLTAGATVSPGDPFKPISRAVMIDQFNRVERFVGQPITLRFISPLRLELPESEAARGHRFADATALIPGQLLRAVQKRLTALGIRRSASAPDPPFDDSAVTLLENCLVWLDLQYGRRVRRRSLGGALGRLRIALHDPLALAALVWGQYARVGRNLHFGFGRYRIEELGPDPTACRRAVSLLDLALAPARVAAAAADHDLPLEQFRAAADELRAGVYRPDRPNRVVIRDRDGGVRELLVPVRRDRALQRLLLARLEPACDRLFETSSFAWRTGLSREAAARRIERLANAGWVFAARADFDRFFDSVPHRLLEDRLQAWLGEDACVAALMTFVRSGIAGEVGLPTGAPLSPLLGNLFLDRFDELVARDGGRLVRYADDFLVLTRTRAEADLLHRRASDLAAELALQLNDDAAVIDLREPFTFLGFEFRLEDRWQYGGPTGPRRVRELGWKDADRTPSPLALALPGESAEAAPSGVLLVGQGVERIDVVGDNLVLALTTSGAEQQHPVSGVERLVVLGPVPFTADAPGKLLRAGVPVQFVSEGGWPLGELSAEPADDPEAVAAQCRAAADPSARLRLAVPLVRAKLRNFAALAAAVSPESPVAARLRELADSTSAAASLDALRGLEGAGAAIWYRLLPGVLGSGFRFTARVAPDAADPVNALLNIGHTMLYRHAVAACRAVGLSPAIGSLHSATPRFAALAADLQEPFRHLVERAVILATRRLKPNQFIPQDDGPYRLALQHHADKTFHAILQRSWRAVVVGRGQTDPRAWLGQLIATARGLKRHLLDPTGSPWEPFEHP